MATNANRLKAPEFSTLTKREKLGFGKNTGCTMADLMGAGRNEDGDIVVPEGIDIFALEMELLYIAVRRVPDNEAMTWDEFLDSDYELAGEESPKAKTTAGKRTTAKS